MYLVDLELKNVRAIHHMRVDFRGTPPGDKTRRWTVLLGENGCGKSTVLKSIGLLLAGSEALPDLLGSADQWIRNDAKQAVLEATICTDEGQERRLRLELNRGDGRDTVIKRNAKGLKPLDAALKHADRNYFIAGYGAFRRPPGPGRVSSQVNVGRAAQLATMFSNEEGLVSLEQWAIDRDYVVGAEGRSVIAEALKTLLPGMTFKDIDKANRSVIMSTVDGDVPLRQLSEGYQAMAAWAGDLLFRMTETFQDHADPLAARGVLLIDEMDMHLHPVWKRNLVAFLNSAFPRLQIIATTHSPLSIQECGEGELFVVRREVDGPTLVPFKGDPSRLRLSELFLSPLIGLETLDSPKVAALRQEARALELQSGRSSGDNRKLRSIQQQLDGTTPLARQEAPAFAAQMARSASTRQASPSARMAEGAALFGVARVAMPARVATKVKAKAPAKKLVAKRAAVKVPPKSKVAPKQAPKVSASVKKVAGGKPAGGTRAAAKAPIKALTKPAAKASKKTIVKAVRKAP